MLLVSQEPANSTMIQPDVAPTPAFHDISVVPPSQEPSHTSNESNRSKSINVSQSLHVYSANELTTFSGKTTLTSKDKSLIVYKCKCHRVFNNTSALNRHVKFCKGQASDSSSVDHQSLIVFSCDICKKHFNSKANFKQHQIKSSKCKKIVENRSLTLALSDSSQGNVTFPCALCGKSFQKSNGLSSHKKWCKASKLKDKASEGELATTNNEC